MQRNDIRASSLVCKDTSLCSYVIRENDNPPTDGQKYASFFNETVYCAPLLGSYYDADKLLSFNTGQTSEDWIKGVSC